MTGDQARSLSAENAAHNSLPKELLVGKGIKKESLAWKLFFLIFVGSCGLLLGLARASQKSLLSKANYSMQGTVQSIQCSGNKEKVSENFKVHYPQPNTFERQECLCTPVHYFVILSMQRSGSGWFETLLNNHPNISSHGEIFAGRQRHNNLSIVLKKLDEVFNLDYRSSAVKEECTSAVGFKWMLNQGVMEYHKEMALYFKERGVSLIFLLRRNLLRRLVSILANAYDREMKLLNGTHKSHVHSRQEADTLATFKPIINYKVLPTSFRRVLDISQNALEYFNNTRHTLVYYEDLVKNNERLDHVQKFLGVPPIGLESKQVKIHTRPLSEQIQNWDLVYKALKGTEFEDFLTQTDYT
eukprot:c14000_g1_i1 orf=330-1400(-)